MQLRMGQIFRIRSYTAALYEGHVTEIGVGHCVVHWHNHAGHGGLGIVQRYEMNYLARETRIYPIDAIYTGYKDPKQTAKDKVLAKIKKLEADFEKKQKDKLASKTINKAGFRHVNYSHLCPEVVTTWTYISAV